MTSVELRVSIDTARCQGHGRCAIVAPQVFDVDDLGQGKVLLDPCPEEFRAAAEEAEFSCPETAITVFGDPRAEARPCQYRTQESSIPCCVRGIT